MRRNGSALYATCRCFGNLHALQQAESNSASDSVEGTSILTITGDVNLLATWTAAVMGAGASISAETEFSTFKEMQAKFEASGEVVL